MRLAPVLLHTTTSAATHPLEVVLGVLTVAAAACYLRGLVRLHHHPQGRRQQRGRPWSLLAAVVVVYVVAASPLGEILEERLSTHMAQHVVLIMVAGPLLAWSAPGAPFLAGLPSPLRSTWMRFWHRTRLNRASSAPLAWLASVAAMWIWHLPGPYDLAVTHELVHWSEHACFLLTAWWFWWYLLAPSHRRLVGLPAAGYVAAAVPPGAALGAVLTFPQHPIYPAQAAEAAAAGINPLLDQRIGALVMWVPLDFVYIILAIALFGRWLLGSVAGDDGLGTLAPDTGTVEPVPAGMVAPAPGPDYGRRIGEQADLKEVR